MSTTEHDDGPVGEVPPAGGGWREGMPNAHAYCAGTIRDLGAEVERLKRAILVYEGYGESDADGNYPGTQGYRAVMAEARAGAAEARLRAVEAVSAATIDLATAGSLPAGEARRIASAAAVAFDLDPVTRHADLLAERARLIALGVPEESLLWPHVPAPTATDLRELIRQEVEYRLRTTAAHYGLRAKHGHAVADGWIEREVESATDTLLAALSSDAAPQADTRIAVVGRQSGKTEALVQRVADAAAERGLPVVVAPQAAGVTRGERWQDVRMTVHDILVRSQGMNPWLRSALMADALAPVHPVADAPAAPEGER